MDRRVSFHSQLSSIMDAMAKSAFSQISKLVDEDSAELRLELSRLLFANSALAEKVNSLECELTIVKSDAPVLCKTSSNVGVQTVCCPDGDPHVSGTPAIEGVFGKDWCMNLWKDRDPCRLETVTNSPQCSDKLLLDQITVTEIKKEDDEDASTEGEHEQSSVVELEQLTVHYSADGSAYSLSFDQEEDLVHSAADTEEPSKELMSINDTEETFSAHIIPIDEDDDDDDDVLFVEESHQEPAMDTAWAPGNNEQQTLLADTIENSTALEKDSHDNFNMLNAETVRDLNKDIFQSNPVHFTCKICSKTFYHKGTLTHHMKFHKSNFCSICKQHFPDRSTLNMHTCIPPVLSHRVAKSCGLCGKTFANPSALRIHYVVHTGEKPHSCRLCGKGFTQKGNLKCHLRIHTGERPFVCGKCGKTFTQKVNLNHHLIAHRNREVELGKPILQMNPITYGSLVNDRSECST